MPSPFVGIIQSKSATAEVQCPWIECAKCFLLLITSNFLISVALDDVGVPERRLRRLAPRAEREPAAKGRRQQAEVR